MSSELRVRDSFRLWLSEELRILSFQCLKHFKQLIFSSEDNLFRYVYQQVEKGYKVR